MAGYMTKLMGYVYDGAHTAAEALENGVLAEITAEGVKKIAAADATVTFRVAPEGKTEMWGLNALTLDVISVGAKEVYLVENEWDINDAEEYNTALYTLPAGKLVRMHRLLPGEQFVTTVTDEVYAAAAVGATMTLAAGGTVAAGA